jgi:dienelactone hydrolase
VTEKTVTENTEETVTEVISSSSPPSCRLAFLLAVVLLALLPSPPVSAAQRVVIRTEDGVVLNGTWYEPSMRPAPAVILVHMLRRTRRDWDTAASRLASAGIGALTFDLRGHGDSQGSAGLDYADMVQDVRAARRFLAARTDVLQGRVGVAGASIGANLAVLAAAGDTTIASLALLSPSLDYRGLRIEAAVRKYGGRPILLVASDEDAYAARSARELQKAGPGRRELLMLSQAGHGTNMLFRSPELVISLVDWFRRTLL